MELPYRRSLGPVVGAFLIDSSAPKSILNPAWIEAQGVLLPWIEIPGARPERANWMNGDSLAKAAQVEGLQISGYAVRPQHLALSPIKNG